MDKITYCNILEYVGGIRHSLPDDATIVLQLPHDEIHIIHKGTHIEVQNRMRHSFARLTVEPVSGNMIYIRLEPEIREEKKSDS